MKSGVVSSGNEIMKEVTLDLQSRIWSLKIRESPIVLDRLCVSSNFDNTKSPYKAVVKIVEKIKICTGLEIDNKQSVPGHIIAEHSTVSKSAKERQLKVRTPSCMHALDWFSTGNTCWKCIQLLNEFTNTCKTDISLAKNDDDDISSILQNVFPTASDTMKVFLKNQHDVLKANEGQEGQVKWDKSIIKTCLQLWCRSPRAYEDLKAANIFALPSGRQLQRYKNITPQDPGLSTDILRWMSATARKLNIPPSGYYGGLVHDEMKIQEGLVLNLKGKENTLVGFVDTGAEGKLLRILKEGEVKQHLASEVLQVTFVGYTGFRFPVAHYPSVGVTGAELYILLWNIVSQLSSWGFTVDFILQGGGDQNRQFMKLNFDSDEDSVKKHFMSQNICNPFRKMAHSQDYSHNMKKLRNAVMSSGNESHHTKNLMKHGNPITWQQWLDAVQWDEKVNSRRVHSKINVSHMYPDSSEKMRNHLAEEMLSTDMLHLMEAYRSTLLNKSALDGAVEFLRTTSTVITIFRDKRPIKSCHDQRLKDLFDVIAFFTEWKDEVEGLSITPKEKEKMLPSKKCLDDQLSLLYTFIGICKQHTKEFPGEGVYPYRFNSDIIENNFCQVRGICNGNSSHPTYRSYASSMNSIILNQSARSKGRNSNAGELSADPYNYDNALCVGASLKRKRKCLSDITNK
ncbi:uncharacterized protein [Argopecten irradians]|uniref:uncharacterized protein n=1 Tax=Argopecten irradians TaxID=31199 RepID=UPI003721E490